MYVFAEEGRLDGQVVGVERVDDTDSGVEDTLYAVFEIRYVPQVEYIHGDKLQLPSICVEEAISEDAGARVDAED